MKTIFRTLIVSCVVYFIATEAGAQCPYDNTIYLTGSAPTVVNDFVEAPQTWAGEFNRLTGMVAGNTYRISTCGTPTFDSQISIYPAGGGNLIASDDDGCGTAGGPSSIDFTPTVSGDYDLLLDFYLDDNNPCSSNQVDMTMRVTLINTVVVQDPPDVTIPVVVHVVYNNQTENISDSQILSQIEVLNADFRKRNSDFGIVPGAFSGVAADTKIEFCMASRTPSGQPTNGITRTQTDTLEFFGDNGVKSNSTGGVNSWDPHQYLNLWVCNLGGGLLGYAQFPADLATSPLTDGVVIGYKYFGTNGAVTSPYDLGRTATHEIGHWLNLRHIWGDANCGDDFVNDTPTQQDHNYQCPNFPHITCSNGPNGDMFMNYMDYVNDNCMAMFTNGQKSRVDATMSGARNSLRTSTGCRVVGIEEIAWLSGLSIYPNPGEGLFHISGTIPAGEKVEMSVMNVMGQMISVNKNFTGNNDVIDLSSVSPGIYTVRFSTASGYSATKKIVKQ
ncbi:MAG: T9SS type A sorting domain-containing protein [Bacteroidetes bacterium]|nr:T9SS type A sorting domain-containing protein [Bacteroidota bacterium]